MSKICTKCGLTKAKEKFYLNNGTCKKCYKARIKSKERTKEGLIARLYYAQKCNSKQRSFRPPEYTKEELKEWLYSQSLFHLLYSEWKQSDYKTSLRPSVDRINDYIHYCLPNIQLLTWKDNAAKPRPRRKRNAN